MTYPEHSWHHHFVFIRSGERVGLLLGPYPTRQEAAKHVARAQAEAERIDPWAWGYTFGTCRVTAKHVPPGRLNRRIGLQPREEQAA